MLKGVDRWERPRDVYTGRIELGGLIATEECQSSVCSSLSRLHLSLWVGKICLTPFSLLPEKKEAVRQMTSLNRWSQWSMWNAERKLRVKNKMIFNFCVISVMRSYKSEDILSKKTPKHLYDQSTDVLQLSPYCVGPPVCRLTKWIFQYALCSWAYFSSTSMRRHQAWFSSVDNTRHSNDSSKCRGLTASIAQQRKNKSQQNHRILELCRRDIFFCILTCLWSKICSL